MCRICVALETEPVEPTDDEKEVRNRVADDVLRYIYQDIKRMRIHEPSVDTVHVARLGNALTHVVVNGFNSMKHDWMGTTNE